MSSVALGNAASIAAFIGLSFNLLHGIHYIHDLIESVNDAPQELRCLYVQLKFFQLSFAAFQQSIVEASRLGAAASLAAQTRLALQDAASTVTEFQTLIHMYGEGRATPFRKKVGVATKSKQIGSLRKRLSTITEQITATHSGVSMMVQVLQHQLRITETTALDQKLVTWKNDIATQFTTSISENFDRVNVAMEDATASIIDLIGDISRDISQNSVVLPQISGQTVDTNNSIAVQNLRVDDLAMRLSTAI